MSRFKSRDNRSNNKLLAANYFINEKIRVNHLQVIGQNGENYGTISKEQALRLADEADLDLVQVGEKDGVIIAKIMDFGKFLYAKKKQQSEAKKKQKVIQVKEIKMRPNIADNDYNTKLKRAIGFLKDGKKVKFTLQFRGRQFIMIRELGTNFFARVEKDLGDQDLGTLVRDKERRGGPYWSVIYYLK